MKKNILPVLSLCAVVLLTGCKANEKAYRQAYEQAVLQDKQQTEQQVVVTEEPTKTTPVVKEEIISTPRETQVVDHSDVREINGELTVVSGNPLKAYSVVLGSFITQANAEDQKNRLQSQGYDARVVKTNETIKGHTGWFRVVAASYDDKASAVQSRDQLKQNNFPDAWLLYRK